jgi:hypothetical protein
MPSHLLDLFVVAPLGISGAPAKQSEKNHGKRTVNKGNGFVSIADDTGRADGWFPIHEL